jgi:hypothetical protein
MLDNRESNWEKSRNQDEKGPKKVEELWQEEQKKYDEEQKKREAAEFDDPYSNRDYYGKS